MVQPVYLPRSFPDHATDDRLIPSFCTAQRHCELLAPLPKFGLVPTGRAEVLYDLVLNLGAGLSSHTPTGGFDHHDPHVCPREQSPRGPESHAASTHPILHVLLHIDFIAYDPADIPSIWPFPLRIFWN